MARKVLRCIHGEKLGECIKSSLCPPVERKKRQQKKPYLAVAGRLEVDWQCPHCHLNMARGIEHSDIGGGCDGNHGSEGYCYCPLREYRERLTCARCGEESEVYV